MNAPYPWLERLYSLSARFSGCGACPDFASMSLADLWGFYRLLVLMANEGGHGAEQ